MITLPSLFWPCPPLDSYWGLEGGEAISPPVAVHWLVRGCQSLRQHVRCQIHLSFFFPPGLGWPGALTTWQWCHFLCKPEAPHGLWGPIKESYFSFIKLIYISFSCISGWLGSAPWELKICLECLAYWPHGKKCSLPRSPFISPKKEPKEFWI